MQNYLLLLFCVSLCFACNTKKSLNEVVATQEEVIEEPVQEYVPDLPNTEFQSMGNCSEDWHKRERLILYKDQDRIGKLKQSTSGQIFVITQVNRDGLVTKATIDDKNTTVKKEIWRNMAREIVLGYEFEPDENAPKTQCGTVKFYLTTM